MVRAVVTAKTQTSAITSRAAAVSWAAALAARRAVTPLADTRARGLLERGFTLIELMVALVIASLVVAVGGPAAYRFYETASYREAVRTVQSAAGTARYRAVASGKSWDLLIDTQRKAVLAAPGETAADRDRDDFRSLGDDLELEATTAREYSRSGLSAIRFFPSGGSTGGSVRIGMPGRATAQIDVDWLTGRVVQRRQDADG